MKRTMGGAAFLAAVMMISPLQVDAQQGFRGQRNRAVAATGQRGAMGQRAMGQRDRGPRGAGVEMIMRQREQLELSDDQVKRLDGLRQEAVQRRSAHQAQIAELRSKVAAGEIEASALREQLQSMREGAEEVQKQQRERIESVLNDAQKQKIAEGIGRARAFQMGRQSVLRGQGRQGPAQGRQGVRGSRSGQPGPQGMRGRRGGPPGGPGMWGAEGGPTGQGRWGAEVGPEGRGWWGAEGGPDSLPPFPSGSDELPPVR